MDGHYGDNFIPVIPVDRLIHTDERPLCSDPECPCHDALKQELAQYYQEGLITADDATRIVEGRQAWQ
ncbi:MAG: hypothetical protein M3Y81_25475 [Chloroflexota bacterium]|nr:hypothetical protein [Chloroflexota bacterium]